MADHNEISMKAYQEVFDAINDPNDPIKELMRGMYMAWRREGYNDDQARFLACWQIGYRPTPTDEENKTDDG